MTDTPAGDEAVDLEKPDEDAPDAAATPSPADIRRFLPFVGLFIAFWASLPKYSGPFLNTSDSAEFADHIVPAVLVAIVSIVALLSNRKAKGPTAVPFFCGMAILLAGFWMVATHVPLISEAFRDLAPWAATVYHSSAAFAVFGFGLFWTVTHWSDLAAIEAAEEAKKAASAG
jgi:amino acid transporter